MSRCRDGFCGADDCERCYPNERLSRERDERADEIHDERAQREMEEAA